MTEVARIKYEIKLLEQAIKLAKRNHAPIKIAAFERKIDALYDCLYEAAEFDAYLEQLRIDMAADAVADAEACYVAS